jgi:hypothetical protein
VLRQCRRERQAVFGAESEDLRHYDRARVIAVAVDAVGIRGECVYAGATV